MARRKRYLYPNGSEGTVGILVIKYGEGSVVGGGQGEVAFLGEDGGDSARG